MSHVLPSSPKFSSRGTRERQCECIGREGVGREAEPERKKGLQAKEEKKRRVERGQRKLMGGGESGVT